MGQTLERSEEEILEKLEDLYFDKSKSRWLPADFGQREAQLRELHKLTMQDIADRFGTSVSTISRLENGMSSTISIELLSGLADLYGVSTDFLLGKLRDPERMYFSLKDIGLSPKAGLALYSGKADADMVSRLLENKKFDELTHRISDYVVGTEEGFELLVEMTSDKKYDRICDSSLSMSGERVGKYFGKINDIQSESKLNSIATGLKEPVKELKEENDAYLHTGIRFTTDMLLLLKEIYPEGNDRLPGGKLTPEKITERIAELIEKIGQGSENGREFIGCLKKTIVSMELENTERTEVADI